MWVVNILNCIQLMMHAFAIFVHTYIDIPKAGFLACIRSQHLLLLFSEFSFGKRRDWEGASVSFLLHLQLSWWVYVALAHSALKNGKIVTQYKMRSNCTFKQISMRRFQFYLRQKIVCLFESYSTNCNFFAQF